MTITIGDITIEVHKKEIKNMHLYVKPPLGSVSISAPAKMSNKAIELFARTKIAWIKKQIQSFQSQRRQTLREYVSGETLYLWGKQYFLTVEHGTRRSMRLSGNKAILTVPDGYPVEKRTAFVNDWYRESLKAEVERVLPKLEKLSGLKCKEWRIKNMTTCWGTCNIKAARIWLNLQLAKYESDCLEYVILHELTHLKERSHGDGFTAFLDKLMPSWRSVRERLNHQPLESYPT